MYFYIPGIQKVQIQMQTFTSLEIGTKSTTIISNTKRGMSYHNTGWTTTKDFSKRSNIPGDMNERM